MKRTIIISAGFFALALGLISCSGAGGNDPGSAYMPDMYYARAYETYGYNNVEGEYDSLRNRRIYYSAMPVPGTIARGDVMPHRIGVTDSAAAKALVNPMDSMAMTQGIMKEAERLYLINCGICHGSALDGNGPIYNGGNGPYPAVPANLKAPNIQSLSDGHYFYVITHGIRSMGSYASQLTPDQRWWVIKYIRSKQLTGAPATQVSDTSSANSPAATTGTDTTNRN